MSLIIGNSITHIGPLMRGEIEKEIIPQFTEKRMRSQ